MIGMSSSTFGHGQPMNDRANEWTRYFTGGRGNYMISAMEDTGMLQALTFLSKAGRADLKRVLVRRTLSHYDREAPGSTAAAGLASMGNRAYSGFAAALEAVLPRRGLACQRKTRRRSAAEKVGDRVVRYLVEHWAECESRIPQAQW